MKPKGEVLHFDMQNGTFFRVSKQTGNMKPSYMNGEDLPIFKPGITGMSFEKRKSLEKSKSRSPQHSPGIKKLRKNLQRHSQTKNYHTIDVQSQKTRPYIFDTLLSKGRKSMIKEERSQLSFYDLKVQNRKEKQEGNNKIFQETSQIFQDFNQTKGQENHSPKKDIDGSVPKKKNLDQACITMQNFLKSEEKYLKKEQSKKKLKLEKIINNQKLPKQFDQLEQLHRQRNILYRFHPQLLYRQNAKSIEKQKQRRKNMIKLQKLAISVMNKSTKDPFE